MVSKVHLNPTILLNTNQQVQRFESIGDLEHVYKINRVRMCTRWHRPGDLRFLDPHEQPEISPGAFFHTAASRRNEDVLVESNLQQQHANGYELTHDHLFASCFIVYPRLHALYLMVF